MSSSNGICVPYVYIQILTRATEHPNINIKDTDYIGTNHMSHLFRHFGLL